MAGKKIFIHAGLPKTASTFLQERLFPALGSVKYIGRPYTQENEQFNKLQYADDLLFSQAEFNAEALKLRESTRDEETLLISDELFSGWPLYNFINRGMISSRLKTAFPEAEIILFLRAQEDLVISLYNQFVKIGWFDGNLDSSFIYSPGSGYSLDDWNEGRKIFSKSRRFINHRSLFTAEHLRYSTLISHYREVFPRVHLFLYEDLKKDQAGTLNRLATLLGTTLPAKFAVNKEREASATNKSIQKRQLKTRLLVNRAAHLVPGIRTGPGFSLMKAVALLMPDHQKEGREHVAGLMRKHGLYEDNHVLNKELTLGMERYSAKYFGKSSRSDH